MNMIMDIVAIVGFILTMLVTGISAGRFIEKIERFIDDETENHKNTENKNDRH